MKNASIKVMNLSKQYTLGAARRRNAYGSLRETLEDSTRELWRRLRHLARRRTAGERGQESEAAPRLFALKDVSFKVRPGEMIGVIGHNGAGKSTLLKILSRITEPTSGKAVLQGRVGSLLEVGTGFHPELTGRENVYLNGAILGMSRQEIARKFDSIVDFSELEPFIDTPVKRYSSGMYVRLAFAVSAHLSPDILLLDEVLAVGDLAFQRKCLEHTKALRDRQGIVLLVSHNMFAIKAVCNRVLYLSRGAVAFDGDPESAIQMYEADSRLDTPSWAQGRLGQEPSKRQISLTDIQLLDEGGECRTVFEHGERVRVRLHFSAPRQLDRPNINVSFIRSDQVGCCNFNTLMDGFEVGALSGNGTIELLTPPLKLVSDLYTVHVLVWDAEFKHLYNAQVGGCFHVRHPVLSSHFGVFHESGEWAFRGPPSCRAQGADEALLAPSPR